MYSCIGKHIVPTASYKHIGTKLVAFNRVRSMEGVLLVGLSRMSFSKNKHKVHEDYARPRLIFLFQVVQLFLLKRKFCSCQ